MIIRLIRTALLTLAVFLIQTTIPSNIAINGVAPNLALMILAIVSVGWGRKYTFFMSLAVGYLIEITLPAMSFLNLILYPVAAVIGSLPFSDKSERKLEEQRAAGRVPKQMNPHIRTPLAVALSCAIFEAVHLIYIYLNGVTASYDNISRAVIDVLYTTGLTTVLQFPFRWLMGVYKIRKAR